MKTLITSIFLVTILSYFQFGWKLAVNEPAAYTAEPLNEQEDEQPQNIEDEDESNDSPESERNYFEKWHEPYGYEFTTDKVNEIWNDVHSIQNEESSQSSVINSWNFVGPFYMNNTSSVGTKYTGRILDIGLIPPVGLVGGIRIASASGGIWQYVFAIPSCMTNSVTSLATSTFATKPGDNNTVFVGTGEPSQRTGTGLWKTVNGGNSWVNVPMNPVPGEFFRLRYTPGNVNKLHAATTSGYYRSDDGGNTWTLKFYGNVSDIAFRNNNTNQMYLTKWGYGSTGGVYYTLDGGDTWTKYTAAPLPTTNIGRGAVTACVSNPAVIYVLLTKYDFNSQLGIYKTTNYGSTWLNVSPPDTSLLGGNGWYNAIIGVNPQNPNIVIAGMSNLIRSTDGGSTWSQINDPDVHPDQHAITWSPYGDTVWVGNDGGLSTSYNNGAAWNTNFNTWGITQYYNFDIGTNNTSVICGGSQDNGLSVSTNLTQFGGTWNYTLGGDGAGVTIDRYDASKIYAINGAYGGSNLFWRQKSGNYGQSWSAFNGGINTDKDWAPKIRHNYSNPPMLYTNADSFVYVSSSPYSSWSRLNTTGFATDVADISISPVFQTVYACLSTTSPKLMVYDGSVWYDRSAGLPSGTVRTIEHKVNSLFNVSSFAIMNGMGTPGQKIYRTNDRGVTWINMTGDLPNVPLADMIADPRTNAVNTYYVGSEYGCYKTTNNGVNWIRWNNGMPEANIITEMHSIDSLSTRGTFYIVASSFGRGIWMREISGDDPTAINNSNIGIPKEYSLEQNFPNPFNPVTTIKYSIPAEDHVSIRVYDILGKEAAVLVDKNVKPGNYEIKFDASQLSSGAYFYKIETSEFTDVKKMVLVK